MFFFTIFFHLLEVYHTALLLSPTTCQYSATMLLSTIYRLSYLLCYDVFILMHWIERTISFFLLCNLKAKGVAINEVEVHNMAAEDDG